ncbi:MAG TPA: tetratricopeptide repeat protein [Candidatus Sulfotelmatobacter sp.]|nr:tetratricopeptide repeat protein [Candidatus Sulfotelmatobacter sp.]
MTPEQWQQIKKILGGALERPPSERQAYLDRECPDPSFRREVDSLIAACDAGDTHFLEQPEFQREDLEPGVLLGPYEILSHLGSGGMGEVYRARDTKLNREIALKLLPRDFMRDPGALVRFEREAHVLASLNHPNVVTVYGIGQDRGAVYIAMELVDGKTLDEVLTSGPMHTRQILDVAAQVAAGLAVAHKSQIVHRDLKPKNVMLRPDGLVKILDFGLSKLTQLALPDPDETSALTVPGILLGTIDYMSPEQASGRSADFRSDQFSLGSLVYEITTGRRPFQRPTGAETLAAIIEAEPTPVRAVNPHIPFALETIVRRCMSKEPEKRYESTDDLARAFREILESTPFRTTQAGPAIANRKLRGLPMRLQPTLAAAALFAGMGLLAPRLAERVRSGSQPLLPSSGRELVVLPFTNVGNDPQNQSFCDGLEEILTSELTQLDQYQQTFDVVPSIEVLRNGIVSVREARQVFGADLAITGSVQRTTDRIRLTINLVDPRKLVQLKSKTFDTDAQDVLALQDGVVLQVGQLLDVKISTQAKQALSTGGTTTPSAFDLYTQGRGYLQRYESTENIQTAISLFKLALQKDPRYALAEAALGEAYWRTYSQTKDAQWAESARKSSAAAIEMNDKLPQVYVTLGMVQTGTGHYAEASQSLQKALRLDPANADANRELAKTFEALGQLKDAESAYLNAVALRPGYWAAYNELGGFYYRLGRYDDAEKEFLKVVELTPDNARGYSNVGVIAYSQKRYEEAAKMYEKSLAIKPSDGAYLNLGTVYYTMGNYGEAARYYDLAVQMNGHDATLWHNLATAYEWSGQPQKARAAFQKTAELAEEERRVNPRDPSLLIELADDYSMLDQAQRARKLLGQALKAPPDAAPDTFEVAVVYEQLGDRKLALRWLGKAIQRGFPRDVIEKSPSLSRLRGDPGYQDLFRP